jgi:RNA polymerase sigma-70 factor (family 1)
LTKSSEWAKDLAQEYRVVPAKVLGLTVRRIVDGRVSFFYNFMEKPKLPELNFSREYDEKALLLLVTGGDEEAFTRLFHEYRNKIYSIAYDLTESASVSEEIVQDVFLKIWIKRESLGEVDSFRAYLFTITRNHVFTTLKKMVRRRNQEIPVGQETDETYYHGTEDQVLNREYARILRNAVDRLPERQKQVYVLIKERGVKRDAAAAALQLSPETVKTHLTQAMRNIRAYCLAHLDLFIGLILLVPSKK